MKTENTHIEDILFDYFSDNLSEAEEKELLQWLESDGSHTDILSEMADWWATAHAPAFASDMKSDFETHFGYLRATTSQKKTGNKMRMWSMIAASVLILILVGTFSFYMGKNNVKERMAYFETMTPMGTCSKVILPDHSVVWINAGSSLKYSKDFNQKNREVLLNGEAYFEVQPDSLKPFIVKAGVLDIQVLGTHFNVKAYRDEQIMDVALISGKVNVYLNEKDHSGSNGVILEPNRMFSFNKESKCVKIVNINGEDSYAWINGSLKFIEQPFYRIAKDLERKFNVNIRIDSKSLNKEVFSGSFSSGYSLNEILNEVDVDHKYIWKQNGNEIVIRDK